MQANYVGTRNLIETTYELGEEKSCAFVDIGTAAETGDRMPPIHWGRVGDPITPSMFDCCAVSKVAAEHLAIESGLAPRETMINGPIPPQGLSGDGFPMGWAGPGPGIRAPSPSG
ncbi:MAG: hypothetical protein SOI43_05820, partial [Olsenella sp.]